MVNTQKKINIDEDRLSNLPGDVIERIMDLLPVRNAARTCVLSTKWRYIWANHPSLVLDDKGFWNDIDDCNIDHQDSDINYSNVVSSLLLSHFGHIRKFVIDISSVDMSHKSFHLWVSYLCRKSLKVLHFLDSGGVDDADRYQVPSCVFLTSKLNHLRLHYCNIKETVGCFNSIQCLILEYCRIDSLVLTTPLLTSLSINDCVIKDTDFFFYISAPKLSSLTLIDNDFFNLQPFFTCTDIEYVFLAQLNEDSLNCDGKHLLDLLALWPKLSVLVLDGYIFKLATARSIPDTVPISQLNLRSVTLCRINVDCEKISWILYVLKNSPLLHTFEIRFGSGKMNDIEEPSLVDFEMGQLRTIKIKGLNEVIFINILLKCAPLLEKMLVEENVYLDPWMQIKILKEVNLLQRKHRNTEIIFAQIVVPRDLL